MISFETLVTFFAASALLAIAPGPDNIFVLTQSAMKGRSAGLLVTLGLCTGLIFHTTAVSLGVAVIFKTSAIAFSILKYLGAVYLLYLAWQAFHAKPARINAQGGTDISRGRLYGRGIIMNVTNPKVSIFFLAFLPQFADPARGPVSLQMMQLGGIFIVATIIVFGSIALMAGTIGGWLSRSERAQSIINKAAGLVFVGIALKLATTHR